MRPPIVDISKLIKMSLAVTVQTTVSAFAFHVGGLSSLTKVLLDFILVSNLVGYVCCMTAVLLIQRKPEVAEIFGWIGSGAVALGFLLLILMSILDSLA